ncbi:NUDIX hydrolase [Aureimonas sp. ME7]|uniref:NUDIX hydrolase n=1 Tax=Aureimonas sp. ME7 TaxID=2744252 RepID=UPI0015F598E0|nr:NUDIX hydrolase [Aureimonas sp. ME7]
MARRASQDPETNAPVPEPRDQIAALPVRVLDDGTIEILLVTSRETRRWIVPKGWPMNGLRDDEAAGVEAREEAGIKGKLLREPIGRYAYWQRTRTHMRFNQVDVFLMRVDKMLKRWKEKDQRERQWFTPLDAADLVLEPQLGQLFLRLSGQQEARRFLRLDKPKGEVAKPKKRKADDAAPTR